MSMLLSFAYMLVKIGKGYFSDISFNAIDKCYFASSLGLWEYFLDNFRANRF